MRRHHVDRNLLRIVWKYYTHVVWHHDGKQGLVVGIERYIQSGGLNHDEDGMKN